MHDQIKFYGRRKGKAMTAFRNGLLEIELPKYLPQKTLKPTGESWMEVGFGNGEFLSHICQSRSDIDFIGCEPFVNGVAAFLASLEKSVTNLTLWMDDARLLMKDMPNACLDRFYLLNPDPWPKTRHVKRRFIQPETLAEISRLLKSNGKLIMSSDHYELINWMYKKTSEHDQFIWANKTGNDWLTPPSDWPIDQTRYMKKGLAGKDIYWLIFNRQ
jgi:tRNA (guanine-N7-)-methyltransferase